MKSTRPTTPGAPGVPDSHAATPTREGGAPRYDVLVVGGGAAGLSGATALARARRSVLVVDAGEPRNAPAAHVHAYLSRDGAAPTEILAAGREELASYGGGFTTDTVSHARREEDGDFVVSLADGGDVRARRLLLTSGVVDELPDVPGLAERWGRDVLHCPYCHGWEVRDQPIGILATSPLAVHQAVMWRQWSADITLFTHTAPELGEEEYEQLAALGIAIVEGEVVGLELKEQPAETEGSGRGALSGVRLADGHVIPRRQLVVSPRLSIRSELLEALGLRTRELEIKGYSMGTHIQADATGATEVTGVWAAGNVVQPIDQVIAAAAAGNMAAGGINNDLTAEDAQHALKARRQLTTTT